MIRSSFCALAILLLFGSGCASAFNNQDHPPRPTIGNERPNLDFGNYRTPLFFGPIANLKGYTQDNSGIWRDEIGKRVSKPSINYAGKYFISLHSCGGSCRYYTMSDMSNGKDLDILDRFSSTESSGTPENKIHRITKLLYQPESMMLVAQYLTESGGVLDTCHEQIFVLEGESLHPLTEAAEGCRE